jgi:YbbR domain-containing protein
MDNGNKKGLVVKLICVLLSFGVWLYVSNVENPTRTSDVKDVPIEIVNEGVLDDSNLCITSDQTFTVNLKLEGPANEIYSVKKSDFVIKADLSSYALKKGENNIPVQIESYPEGLTIKNSGVLAVKVNIENKAEKEVEVYSCVKTTFKSGFTQSSMDVEPSTIKVSGPESAVNKVSKVALKGEKLDISSKVNERFNLVAVDAQGNEVKGVNLSESEGILSIGVGNQKEVSIKPTYTGKINDNLTLESTVLSKDKVTIVGSYDEIENIDSIETEPIDLSSVSANQDIKVKLKLPKGISLASGQNYVIATIKVKSNIITKTIEGVQVTLLNKKDGTLKYDVPTISVEVSGTQDVLNSITATNISATASVGDITEAGEKDVSIDISIVNADESLKITSKPEKVKVTVK